MIEFYSGTPGSGKSLHVAEKLYYWVRAGLPAVGNFDINLDRIKTRHKKEYVFKRNDELTPEFLIAYANEQIKKKGKVKEDSILLVIDECQLMFNARDWTKQGRGEWLHFFTLHRHLGYKIILVAQFDRMIDRQVRSLIEYEYIHRKVSNFGIKGKIVSALALNFSRHTSDITACMTLTHCSNSRRLTEEGDSRGPAEGGRRMAGRWKRGPPRACNTWSENT